MLVLFVLNQRVFARRGQQCTATFMRRLTDKTSLIDQCLAPDVAIAKYNYDVEFSRPQRTYVVSWPVIMRSR